MVSGYLLELGICYYDDVDPSFGNLWPRLKQMQPALTWAWGVQARITSIPVVSALPMPQGLMNGVGAKFAE